MRAFIACSEADEAVAKELQEYLKPYGLFAEVETGAGGFRHLQKSDVVIALWSRNNVFGTHRMQLEKRMLDAWADEQLVIVKLDHHFLPVGLRDLPSIDGAFETARQTVTWREVSREAKERINALLVAQQSPVEETSDETGFSPPGAAMRKAGPAPQPEASDRAREAMSDEFGSSSSLSVEDVLRYEATQSERAQARGGFGGLLLLLLGLVGLAGIAGVVRLATGQASLPGVEIKPGGSLMETVLGSPVLIGAAALSGLLLLVALFAMLGGLFGASRGSYAPPAESAAQAAKPAVFDDMVLSDLEAAPAEQPVVFVSYAHADNDEVEPLVTVVRTSGREVWIDKGGIQAGTGWAGEIVRAIKSSGGIMIMCSSSAFKSDHVKREIYLADRYRKPMLPVFLEDAQPPEDFEFFFAGVQWLQLFKLPTEDRAGAVERALAAVS
ncbi:MAG: toll/interleukin-1 receptor domain-containing protein [Henriciella sp.]